MTGGAAGRGWLPRLLAVILLIGVGAAIYLSPAGEALNMDSIEIWIEQGRNLAERWWAPIAFVAMVAMLTVLPVPASLFVVLGAVLWGWAEGGLYVLAGCLLAAWVSFELARWVIGGAVMKYLSRKFPKLYGILDQAGAQTVAVLRLVPGIPFFVFNYGSGVTSMRLKDFLLGSSIGLPVSVFVVAFSADAIVTGALGQADLVNRLLIVSLVAAAVISLLFVIRRRFSVVRELESTVSSGDSL
ncbi:MAG: VTT domain-containing protein [Acidobacteria bacterium]|nr:VTT domain-containing protein [Acidobacteriota bacterium]